MDEEPAEATVASLHAEQPLFDWVGIYWREGETLVLGPYRGLPTEHTRIPVGEGVCGAVASAGITEVVPDVRRRPGHIACSVGTRSEVVAPILRHGEVVGVLDVDSDTPDAFDAGAVRLVESAAARIGANPLP